MSMFRMVKVKICGITNYDDAMASIELGADALGFNFYKKSPRYIDPSQAKSLIESLPPLVSMVGVFVDEFSPDRVVSIAHGVGVGSVQLHGSEGPEYAKQISEVWVFKAFPIDENFNVGSVSDFPANAFLLDTKDKLLKGGTGNSFDWTIALEIKKKGRIILAGGLKPENVFEAICKVQPYGIDVCSGVESEPGKKDLKKLEDLFYEIHRAKAELWNMK